MIYSCKFLFHGGSFIFLHLYIFWMSFIFILILGHNGYSFSFSFKNQLLLIKFFYVFIVHFLIEWLYKIIDKRKSISRNTPIFYLIEFGIKNLESFLKNLFLFLALNFIFLFILIFFNFEIVHKLILCSYQTNHPSEIFRSLILFVLLKFTVIKCI